MRDAEKAWVATLRAAENQLRLLTEAVQRPEISPEGLTHNALALLLDALAAAARTLTTVPETNKEVAAFLQAYVAYQETAIDVQLHLPALATDWHCADCGGDIARGARVQGVRRGPLVIALTCRACGNSAPLTEAGRQGFMQRFGHLQSPSWNPRMNGFEWDGT